MMNSLLKEAYRIILVMTFFLHSPFTIGEEQVSWAGFSFISQADETEKLYPFSLSIEKSVLRPLLTEMVVSQKYSMNRVEITFFLESVANRIRGLRSINALIAF